MHCIHLHSKDPYFCLAAEEYLLKNFEDDIFMIWQSEETVVAGKHQNVMAEINYPYILGKSITVARRISGGGTVFHDAGNVNFTYIRNVKSPAEISFDRFTRPVVEALGRLGVEAATSGRNDLMAGGYKISGNAEHIFKNRVLHHGTLLFDSDLENLGQAIRVVPGKYKDKAVQSNRSEVANISSFLKQKMDVASFMRFLIEVQLEKEETRSYSFSDDDNEVVGQLAKEKFMTWEWNYGYSPKYTFQNQVELKGKEIIVELNVKKGIIESGTIRGNYFSKETNDNVSSKLSGERHCFNDIKNVLGSFTENIPDELVFAFF